MREGKCTEGCAACCRYVVLQVNPLYVQQDDARRWLECHAIKVRQTGRQAWAYIPAPCEKLTPEGMCSVYRTSEYPQVCDMWPNSQAEIDDLHGFVGEKVCTYSFGDEEG